MTGRDIGIGVLRAGGELAGLLGRMQAVPGIGSMVLGLVGAGLQLGADIWAQHDQPLERITEIRSSLPEFGAANARLEKYLDEVANAAKGGAP